jgi:hypothetical protein
MDDLVNPTFLRIEVHYTEICEACRRAAQEALRRSSCPKLWQACLAHGICETVREGYVKVRCFRLRWDSARNQRIMQGGEGAYRKKRAREDHQLDARSPFRQADHCLILYISRACER